MEVLFGKPPRMTREVERQGEKTGELDLDGIKLDDAVERVLKFPAVGSKKFLITIGDRTVGGLVTRDQMVGPWQVPVSDVAVSASAFDSVAGEAMAMGERTPLAVLNAPAAARMAIAEAVTNIAAADVRKLSDIKLSANWMAAAGHGQEDERLFDSVRAVGEEFAPALGLTIPVGKDSLSMRTAWEDGGKEKSVTSPVSLIVTGFSPVGDTGRTLTPQLRIDKDTVLILVDLGEGNNRLGGSILAQSYGRTGGETPDIAPAALENFFNALVEQKSAGRFLAYHDRSDGGLLAAAAEMAFAGRTGLELDISELDGGTLEKLFNEEPGAVIQVAEKDAKAVLERFGGHAHIIGRPSAKQELVISDGGTKVYANSRAGLESLWSDTSYRLQRLRDNPESADQEFAAMKDDKDPGISPVITFDPSEPAASDQKHRPKVAIFREQGVNGQVEMAAAFERAGFAAVDVHMRDLITGRHDLDDFVGLAVSGGFSYGDVLGAGEGWAKSILLNDDLRGKLSRFFSRQDTFTLGSCNGCQMIAALKGIIPGAGTWPEFLGNKSEQFEARVSTVLINESPSILLKGMAGSRIPVPVAHGEGRAVFAGKADRQKALDQNLVAMQYVDNYGQVTEKYPANPNGSEQGITSLTTPDGRATIFMPHPERAFLSRQLSWRPGDWGEDSPWMQIFHNARAWVEDNRDV
jgi:phosphoribosylformylglycinamidine synthase